MSQSPYETVTGLDNLKIAFLLYFIGGILGFIPIASIIGGLIAFVGLVFLILS